MAQRRNQRVEVRDLQFHGVSALETFPVVQAEERVSALHWAPPEAHKFFRIQEQGNRHVSSLGTIVKDLKAGMVKLIEEKRAEAEARGITDWTPQQISDPTLTVYRANHPIIVKAVLQEDGSFIYWILDGQHRFETCRLLGLPFTFNPTISDDIDATSMNRECRPWVMQDYLKVLLDRDPDDLRVTTIVRYLDKSLFAESPNHYGLARYAHVRGSHKDYGLTSIPLVVNILTGSNRPGRYRQKATEDFKKGTFKIKQSKVDEMEDILDIYTRAWEACEQLKGANFFAFCGLFRRAERMHPFLKRERLIKNLAERTVSPTARGGSKISDLITVLQPVYAGAEGLTDSTNLSQLLGGCRD